MESHLFFSGTYFILFILHSQAQIRCVAVVVVDAQEFPAQRNKKGSGVPEDANAQKAKIPISSQNSKRITHTHTGARLLFHHKPKGVSLFSNLSLILVVLLSLNLSLLLLLSFSLASFLLSLSPWREQYTHTRTHHTNLCFSSLSFSLPLFLSLYLELFFGKFVDIKHGTNHGNHLEKFGCQSTIESTKPFIREYSHGLLPW